MTITFSSIHLLHLFQTNYFLESPRFITDVHLGRLTRYCRLCGFDTCFNTDLDDKEIIELSILERRIILTRDKELLKNKKVMDGCRILSDDPWEQLREVLEKYELKDHITLFSRCMECNGVVMEVAKKDIIDRLESRTRLYYRKFFECPGCRRIYWKGSHYHNMSKRLRKILQGIKKYNLH
jgi:uncharacterized protein with PIN domain